MSQSGIAEVNGTRLHYEVAGSGHPLVLIHGFTRDNRVWDDQFESFAHHYRVIRYDMRGFGKSAVPTQESYSHSEDLKALLERLEIEHAYVLGHSLGGYVAIFFALAYPEATDALIVVDSGPIQSQELAEFFASVWAKAKEAGIQAAKQLWRDSPVSKPAREKPDVASRLDQMLSDYSGWHWVNEDPSRPNSRVPDFSLDGDRPTLQRLEGIKTPTLNVVGERDFTDFQAFADTLMLYIPNSKKVVLAGVGHYPMMEDAHRFNQTVLSFLDEIM